MNLKTQARTVHQFHDNHRQVEYALPGKTAEAETVLSAPPEKGVLRSWLPPSQLKQEVTELLPDNLVPMLDPCLAKFYLSPIDVADPNYCVYFDNAEFKVKPILIHYSGKEY